MDRFERLFQDKGATVTIETEFGVVHRFKNAEVKVLTDGIGNFRVRATATKHEREGATSAP